MTDAATIARRTSLLAAVPSGELLIHEIYQSIQGESTHAGLPCVFIRTSVCDLRCSWCFVPETPVLMADWTWRPIGELRPGDRVLAAERSTTSTGRRLLVPAEVTASERRDAPTVRVNGRLRCTPDHSFWRVRNQPEGRTAHDGWRPVKACVGDRVRFLAAPPPWTTENPCHTLGWLAGVADGDGCFWTLRQGGRSYRRFRLAVADTELLEAFAARAATHGFTLRPGRHRASGFGRADHLDCLWLTESAAADRFEAALAADGDSHAWAAGYLGGIFDAEGSANGRIWRISQCPVANPATTARIRAALDRLGYRYTVEKKGFYLSRDGGQVWRFLAEAQPVLARKRDQGVGRVMTHAESIESVEPHGVEEVVTLATTAGSFVAGGFLVKNCDTPHAFARGTRMPRAEVLRQALAFDCPLVEVTGGEPLLQPDVLPLMAELADAGRTVLLETSGAHDTARVDPRVRIILDVKCPGSGEEHRNHFPNLDRLRPHDEVKFVLASRTDFDYAAEVVREYDLENRAAVLFSTVFGGPEPKQIVEWLLAEKLSRVRFQLQMHKYIWHPKAVGV